MPGATISNPGLPWWLDPKGKSVMDPLYIQLARRAAGMAGLDNPNSIMQVGLPDPVGEQGSLFGKAVGAADDVLPPMLKKLFSSNPKARPAYDAAMKSQMDQVASERAANAMSNIDQLQRQNMSLNNLLAPDVISVPNQPSGAVPPGPSTPPVQKIPMGVPMSAPKPAISGVFWGNK